MTDEDIIEVLSDALWRIHQWSLAYPIDIFVPPDFKTVNKVLQSHGITLDSVAAEILRRATFDMGQVAKTALEETGLCGTPKPSP